MPGPFDDVRVIDFGRYIAGPFCAALLGDLGADVIRVEKRDGREDRTLVPLARKRGRQPARRRDVPADEPQQAQPDARSDERGRARSGAAAGDRRCRGGKSAGGNAEGDGAGLRDRLRDQSARHPCGRHGVRARKDPIAARVGFDGVAQAMSRRGVFLRHAGAAGARGGALGGFRNGVAARARRRGRVARARDDGTRTAGRRRAAAHGAHILRADPDRGRSAETRPQAVAQPQPDGGTVGHLTRPRMAGSPWR